MTNPDAYCLRHESAQALGYTARPSFHQTQRGERGNGTNTTHDCPESHDAAHIDTTVIAFLGPRGTISSPWCKSRQ